MPRRLHVHALTTGTVQLDPAQSRHARDVLRLTVGTVVELFDDAGAIAEGTIVEVDGSGVQIRVTELRDADEAGSIRINIASAVPKGDRADWMVEKLSEIGVNRFIPLAAARSVVLPEGKNKRDRWVRLATESAKQSKRTGVMRIEELMTVERFLDEHKSMPPHRGTAVSEATDSGNPHGTPVPRRGDVHWVLSTAHDSVPLSGATLKDAKAVTLLIGPEGGWTDDELLRFADAGLTAVKLTTTILRVETAAVVAAGIIAVWSTGSYRNPESPFSS